MAHQFYWDFLRLIKGGSRLRLDKKKYEQLLAALAKTPVELDDQQKAQYDEVVEEEIKSGRLPREQREGRLRELHEGDLFVTRGWLESQAAEEATIELRIPGEPEIFEALMKAETPDRVRKLCQDAYVTVKREVEPGKVQEVRIRNWPCLLSSAWLTI
jgi:hypothetical protein